MLPLVIVMSTVAGYVVSSVVLLRCPTLLHRRKLVSWQMWTCGHISHRGGAAERLENTLEAFQHAMDIGTDMLELDVHLTRDGQVVVAHDGSLDRLAGVEGRIEDFDYARLPPLKPELSVTFGGGVGSGTDRALPLLETVFAAFPHVAISIDVKVDNAELVHKVGALIQKYNRQRYTMWGSFWPKVSAKCEAYDPTIGRFMTAPKVALVYLLFYIGLLPFWPLSESYFAAPLPHALKAAETARHPRLVALLGWLGFAPQLYRHLQARGIPVYLWVLNEERHMQEAFSAGVNGVMSDRPTVLRRFMDSHPEYPLPARQAKPSATD
eukprot:EG_transcript_13559